MLKKKELRRDKLIRMCKGPDAIAARMRLKRLDCEKETSCAAFEAQVSPILTAYNEIYKSVVKFGETQDEAGREQRADCISAFINTLHTCFSFVKVQDLTLTIVRQPTVDCPQCNARMVFANPCPQCGFVHNIIDNSPSYRELDRISSSNSPYDRCANFVETVASILGKQTTKPSKEVYTAIRDYAKRFGIPPEKLGKDTIKFFLHISGKSANYRHINLIHYVLTGIPPPRIEPQIIQRVCDRHRLMVSIYDDIKGLRKNSLHNPFTFSQFLNTEGVNMDTDDFSVLKTRDVIRNHKTTMAKIYAKLSEKDNKFDWTYKSTY